MATSNMYYSLRISYVLALFDLLVSCLVSHHVLKYQLYIIFVHDM